mmetsp:Transcript_34155/g.94160  ORF Transcript_34155/g.94160 Transcript_34155/m.94160 type:complete len:474 (+) Transcript_34155:36-1457(+)
MVEESPTIARVLARYPDVEPGSLNFPPEAVEWAERDVDLFVGSGGFVTPKKQKKQEPAAASSEADAPAPTSEPAPPAPTSAAKDAAAAATPAPAEEAPAAAASPVPTTSVPAGEASANSAFAAVTVPTATTELHELDLTVWHGGQYWAPYTTYMEDVGEQGMKLVAALNKCERFRNVGLKKGTGFTLSSLKERFGTGILLREFALEVTSEPPREILSSLWFSLRLELPCSPFMPMYQVAVPAGGGPPVCKAVFGMIMLETATMSLLSDNAVYEKVAAPLRQAFGLQKPTGKEAVPKFPRIYPPRGSPFRPLKMHRAKCTIMPSDCDMYRVIFHPQIVGVCERVNFAAGMSFRNEPAVAVYANLSRPANIGDEFEVRVFVEPRSQQKGAPPQTRALYLFAFVARAGSAPVTPAAAAARCVMAAFMVYGSAPGLLFSEDVSACAASKFGVLEAFGAGGPAPAADKTIDLSKCPIV